MKDKILQIEDLKKYYGKKEGLTKALDGVSMDLFEGEFLAIMGASGSGKSTLLNCLASIVKATSGRIYFEGEDILSLKAKDLADYRGKKIGYIFQNFELIDNLTGRENIELVLSINGIKEKESQKRLSSIASYLEIEDVLDKFPAQMSGGQKQRVAAARSLITNPKLILADEPTGALDSKSARLLMDKLVGLKNSLDTSIIMVSHDPKASSYADRVLFIGDGTIYHELRRDYQEEKREDFYIRILSVMSQFGGGKDYVL